PNGSTVNWNDAMDIREYRYFRTRWGLAGSADYTLGQGSNIYFRGLYSDFHNYGERWAYTLTDNTPGIQLLAPGNVGGGTTAPTFNAQLRHPDIGVGSLMVGGRHIQVTTWFSWDLSASRSFYGNAAYSTAVFNNTLTSSSCDYDPVASRDRKSTRLNSSHRTISYAVFCLKKKTITAPTALPLSAAAPTARD